jgi:hypothetical protein
MCFQRKNKVFPLEIHYVYSKEKQYKDIHNIYPQETHIRIIIFVVNSKDNSIIPEFQ